ncbi:MAG: sugar ABC transporter ATP-binding protein [Armatimonadetes bacterium]|nr:sugar ABC transporter ATP-binding protein [Armatimonadota bacterium]
MRGISKRFAGVQALSRVSLSVASGEIVALLGENGAGKSTLMKILGGVHQADAGEILVSGKPVVIRAVADATRCGIAFIHQELNVVDNLDIAGNVFLGREPTTGGFLRLVDRAKMARETAPLLERLGVRHTPDTPLSRLSLAERQLVEIAKALSINAQLIIMDEPTSSLTLSETERLLSLVAELKRERGVSIVYISHRLGEITRIADRVVGLRDGTNAGELGAGEITHDNMVRLMVGRDLHADSSVAQNDGGAVRLSVTGLRTRRYPQSAVSFALRAGEIVGMAGLVGAGRTEIAQAIFGVEPALSGEITLDGAALALPQASAESIARSIYLAPEDRRKQGIIVEMSLRENISLPALRNVADRFGLVRGVEEAQKAETACAGMGVKTPSVEFLAKNLSGGNQQKVVLAKWLSLAPKVMIFDEPTRGVDVGAKAEIYAQIRALAASGVAVLMISSDMEEVLRLSDRIIVLHEGRVTGTVNRADASEEVIIRLAVGGSIEGNNE